MMPNTTDIPLPDMLHIPGGLAALGSDGALNVNLPDFYLARTPITNAQYMAFVATTGLHAPQSLVYPFDHPDHPVVSISWHDAVAYCAWLSQQTGLAYRLPSEAEWEYAARGGQRSQGFPYAGSHRLQEVGWYKVNSNGTTQPVGLKTANELILHDMSGNVWEWCADHWHGKFGLEPMPQDTPPNGAPWLSDTKEKNARRVVRGGSWFNYDVSCRVSYRDYIHADDRDFNVGFRPARY
ncbi:MAG: formylglycine-generating enzyme family protein [Saprospiraceae bacterium]